MAQGEAPEGVQAPAPDEAEGREGQTPERPEGEPQQEGDGKPEELPDLDALLERYDPEALRKNRKFMGVAGELANRLAAQRAEALASERAEALVQERLDRAEAERSRQAALEAARKGEFYTLGEQTAQQVLIEDQKRHVDGLRNRAQQDVYGSVQRVVDEVAQGFPPEVLAAAAQRLGELPADVPWTEGLKRWLPALVAAQAEHLASQPEAEQRVEKKITPALRARLLAEVNGTEPVADSGGGKAPSARQLTDEQIAEMGAEEWLQVYDIKAGKFKPGVVYKPTRALDTRAMQIGGRGI